VKEKVEVAAIQMAVEWLNPEKNREKMIGYIEKVSKEKAVDLIVFPELANTGYVIGLEEGNREFGRELVKKSEKIPGPTTKALGEAAKKHGVYVVVGISELHPTIPATVYNSCALIGPTGKVIGVQHKLHIPVEEKHYFYYGNSLEVFETELGNIGLMICYDAGFPEVARVLSLKGAEIICSVQAAFRRAKTFEPRRWEYVAAVRGSENRNYVIICNRVGTQEKSVFYGRSAIASPSGSIISQSTTEEEEIIYATLKRDDLYDIRMWIPVFRDRRPEMYDLIPKPF
jgi:predicted amidohydrolase